MKAMFGDKNPTKRADVRRKLSRAAKRQWKGRSNELQALASKGGQAFAKRMREDSEFRKRMSTMNSGENNPAKKPESRKAISDGKKRSWRNQEVRERTITSLQESWDKNWEERVNKVFTPEYSENMSRLMKGRDPVGRPRGPRIVWYVGKQGRIAMRSKPEVQYAKMLDKAKVRWLYEYCTFVVGNRTWTPDFYLPERDLFVEVKGWLLAWVKRKIEMVMTHYSATRFVLIRSDRLDESSP
jgi:hypothetical protein